MSEAAELYRQARDLMAQGDLEGAVRGFRDSAEEGSHFKTFELLGECLMQLNRLREAIAPLAAATTLNQGVRAPALLADVFLRLGERHDAEAAAQLALGRDPNNRMAQQVLAALARHTQEA